MIPQITTAAAGLSTAIDIKSQDGSQDVSTITFPVGDPSAAVTNPWNEDDGVNSKQAFGATSVPVVWLVSSATYNLWWSVSDTSGWDTAVANEKLYISTTNDVTQGTFDAGAFTLTTWGADTNTTQQVTTAIKYLYLSVTLEDVGGKTGNSTITFLGATP